MPDRKKTASDEVLLSSSQIGCCGLYHECSTSMHCIANPDTASRCIYRKTLESGISYYGKTAASLTQLVMTSWFKLFSPFPILIARRSPN